MAEPLEASFRTEGLASAIAAAKARPADGSHGAAVLPAAREATRTLWQSSPGPLVATGHQAGFHHPGILVKELVSDAIAARLDGSVLRILVDQDVHPIGPLMVPRIDPRSGLERRALGCREPQVDVPTGRRPPIELDRRSLPDDLSPSIAAGVAKIDEALRREAAAPSAACQVSAAMDSLSPRRRAAGRNVAATALLATPIGDAILATIADDPCRCALAFNAALAADPRAARPLAIAGERIEVPLWSIETGQPRARVHLDASESAADRLQRLRSQAAARPSRLAPRGLLMTGLLRLVADLFVHGRGGWRYDRITESWFGEWLGVSLAPMAMATADLRLPLGESGASIAEIRTRWHDPARGEAPHPSKTKCAALRSIDAAPRGSAARREAFLAMHRDLDEQRRVRGLESAAGVPSRESIAQRRDWAHPLHDAAAIERLTEDCRRAVSEVDV